MFRHLNQPIKTSDWPGLRVWLIGASTGIGASLARRLSGLGAHLVLSARDQDALEAVATQCRQLCTGNSILVLPLDICDIRATTSATDQIRNRMGGIDLVIFNAGTYDATRIDTLTTKGVERSLRINLLAPMLATTQIVPMLLDSAINNRPRGIAFVGSLAGYRGLPRSLTYGPGKAGLINFAESLWPDLHGMGLNTWMINPGFVRTRLTEKNSFDMPALIEPDEAASAIVQGFASGRFEIHFPRRFSYFMKLLRVLPSAIFLRLTQRLVPPLTREAVNPPHPVVKEPSNEPSEP